MAKFGSYYGLCPLIDQKSLLGVSEDAYPGCVIVTLGKNMAIKYKLSDQKQLHSWSTKEKLSSPVVYDKKGERYVAVFNQYFMRLWHENENLEKIKRKKFSQALHTIIPCTDEPFVVFKNGLVMSLSYALEVRKNFPQSEIIDPKTTIVDQACVKINDDNYVGILLENDKVYTFLWITPDCKVGDKCWETVKKIELGRFGSNVKLNGHLAMLTETGPVLFTLWSDGKLYSYPLDSTEECSGAEKCGTFFSVIESLSREQSVRLLALNKTYLSLFGAAINQEGASLQIYNTQFKVTQYKQQLKLFTEGSKLWLIGNNILLTIGQNLAVIPFHLATEQLAALVGSHKLLTVADDVDVAIITEMVEHDWGALNRNNKTVSNHLVQIDFQDLIKEGWSETAICEYIFPKLIAKNNRKAILNNLISLTDIPECILVTLLSYTLNLTENNSDITKKGLSKHLTKLLDQILIVPFSDALLLPHLRTGLNFDEVLTLLQYLCHLLSENGHQLLHLNITESENIVIKWGCSVLDAHYQQLLLSKNSKIIQNLEYFKTLVDTYSLYLEDFKEIEPVLNQMLRKKATAKQMNTSSLKYSIEKIMLY